MFQRKKNNNKTKQTIPRITTKNNNKQNKTK